MGAIHSRAHFYFCFFYIIRMTFVPKWDILSFMNMHGDRKIRIANQLFMLRSKQGLSLDDVAQKSGISRATLSRIENADVSPTAETLSALSTTFGMPMSRLIAATEDSFPALIPFDDQQETTDPGTSLTRRGVSPVSPDLLASVEEAHLPPGNHVKMANNSKPAQEIHLIVLDGALTVSLDDEERNLTSGDCLRYKAHRTAIIQTPPSRGARFLKIRV